MRPKTFIIFVLSLAEILVFLDVTILPVALPTIERFFHSAIRNLWPYGDARWRI